MENAEQAKAELRVMLISPPTPQPVPVKTYHDGKPWPVAPKPWVGLEHAEIVDAATNHPLTWVNLNTVEHRTLFARTIEARLKEKNHDQ
jgi:hypothetical protein